jgi:8-oxo-dGTP pyrophosphatase MutT (NUDIX family)
MPSAFNSYKPKWLRVYGAICVNERGEVLLVKDRRSKLWSFPKGKCKSDESDLDCALRELREETGLVLREDPVSTHKLRGGVYFVFALASSGLADFTPRHSWEIEEVLWWPLESLPQGSNVDVSIFRTLMRNLAPKHTENLLHYIESPEAHRRVKGIRGCIVESEDPGSPRATPVIRGVAILPTDIPVSSLAEA